MDNILPTYDDDDDEVTFIMCNVCKSKIKNSIYKIHLTTSQHLKKEEALIAAGKLWRERPLPIWTSYMDYLDYLQLDEPIVGLKHVVEVDAPPDSLGPRYMCRLCRFDGDMPEMTHHVISRKHRQKYLETHRPDLVTWTNSDPQPGRVVQAKAGIAERQDGRGVPKKSKWSSASPGAPRVPSALWRGGQTGRLAPGPNQPQLPQQEPAHHRDRLPGWDYPREESYGRGFPESPPHIFASGEELRAEKPQRGSQELVGGFYTHDYAHGLPVDSYHAYSYGDRMHPERADYKEERRGVAYEEEPIMGGAYEDEVGRGRDYAGAGKRGRSYDREGMSGVYEREERRGRAYEEDERWGGAHEGDGFRGEAYEAEAVRSGVYEGKGIRGGAYSSAEPGRYMRVSSGHRSTGSSEREVGGAKRQTESPVREWPTSIAELPETFKRFLCGAAEKRRPSRLSQDREPSMAEGLDSKKLKLDPLIFGKVNYQGKDSESSDMPADLETVDMECVEEANFKREQLCNLLKEKDKIDMECVEEANFKREQLCNLLKERKKTDVERMEESNFKRDQLCNLLKEKEEIDMEPVEESNFKREQLCNLLKERGAGRKMSTNTFPENRVPTYISSGAGPAQDRHTVQKKTEVERVEESNFSTDQLSNLLKERKKIDMERVEEANFNTDQLSKLLKEREKIDMERVEEANFKRDQLSDLLNEWIRRKSAFERGQRDPQDHFDRGQTDSKDHYEEYGRVQKDPMPRGSHERSDPRAMHPDLHEGVWSPQQRLDRVQPPAMFPPHLALALAHMPPAAMFPPHLALALARMPPPAMLPPHLALPPGRLLPPAVFPPHLALLPARKPPTTEFDPHRALPPACMLPTAEFDPHLALPPARKPPTTEFDPHLALPPARKPPTTEFDPHLALPPARKPPTTEFDPHMALPPARKPPTAEFDPHRALLPARMPPTAEFDPHRALPPARMPQGSSSPEKRSALLPSPKIPSLLQLMVDRHYYHEIKN